MAQNRKTADTLSGEFVRKQLVDAAARLDVDGLSPAQKILCAMLAAPVKDAPFPAGDGLEVVVGDTDQLTAMAEGIRKSALQTDSPAMHNFDYTNQPLTALFAKGDGQAPESGAFKKAWEEGGTLLLINAGEGRINPQMMQLVIGEIDNVHFHSNSEGPVAFSQSTRHPDFRVIAFCDDFDTWPGALVKRVQPDNVYRVKMAKQNPHVQKALSERATRRAKALHNLNRRPKP